LSVATSVCSFTAQNLAFVSLPFFFEEVLGRSAVETGLLMTPWPVAVGFVAPIAGWLADKRYPAGILGGIGLATMSVGLVLLAFRPSHAALLEMAWWMAICGVGFGFRWRLWRAGRGRPGAAGAHRCDLRRGWHRAMRSQLHGYPQPAPPADRSAAAGRRSGPAVASLR